MTAKPRPRARVHAGSVSVAVLLTMAFNPAKKLTAGIVSTDEGCTPRAAGQVLRRLLEGQLAERIGTGEYRASAELLKLVRLHSPERTA